MILRSHLSRRLGIGALVLSLAGGLPITQLVAEEGDRPTVDRSDFDARRKLRTAESLMEGGEIDRAVAAFKNLLEQYPASSIRHKVNLNLGRYYLEDANDGKTAIAYLRQVADIREGLAEDEELTGEQLEIFLESIYLTGVAHFQAGTYSKCFPVLRRITSEYPNSIWANQAYYYIGMAHFLQQNWGKAIRYLSLVGTFVDPEAPTAKYVEAGHRLYIKVEDADLPVVERLGGTAGVIAESRSGDQAELQLVDLAKKQNIYIATVATEMGKPDPTDDVLQVVGGDEIRVRYVDGNTNLGERNVEREQLVEVVSTASAIFTNATFEGKAKSAYITQPVYLLLQDADLDTDEQAQKVVVRVSSQFLDESEEGGDEIDLLADNVQAQEQGPQWRVRDEVELVLTEQPTAVGRRVELGPETGESDIETGAIGDTAIADHHHSGRFTGSVLLVEAPQGARINTTDDTLACLPSDRVSVTYVDERHIGGDFKREVEATVPVIGTWNSTIEPSGQDLEDPVDQARKNIIEGEAFLELARIFDSMGLGDGAGSNVDQGLERVNDVIKQGERVPADLRMQAFRHRWEMQILVGDLQEAIATCKVFNAEFPDSSFADEALLGIGKALLAEKEYTQARAVFSQILNLTDSDAMAEAQFLIAESIEEEKGSLEPAIPAFRQVAERFPQSPFTGRSLGKLVQFHIESGDYATANNMLETIFEEHPDELWLDEMLIRWVIMAYRMKNFSLALEKAEQLIFEYPDSRFASKVRGLMQKIQERQSQAQARARAAADDGGDQ